MIITDIEREINNILGIATREDKPSAAPPRRGRPPLEKQPIWSLNFYEPTGNITYAVISMCIKEDFSQSFDELATRVSRCKERPKSECLKVLRELRECGKLGYYDDYTLRFHTWKGGF